MKRKLILSLLAMLLPISAWCADGDTFSYVPDGSNTKFYFRVINEDKKRVELFKDEYEAAVETTDGTSLTSISVPSTVTNGVTTYDVTQIGEWAFNALWDLESLTLPEGIYNINAHSISFHSKLTSIVIPASVTSINSQALEGNSFTSISVTAENHFYSDGGSNAIIETATNTLIVGCRTTVIPNTVTAIGDYAFAGQSLIMDFTIPEGIKTIGDYAFSGMRMLGRMTIPASVSSIGLCAFNRCFTFVTVDPGNDVYMSQDDCIIEKSTMKLVDVKLGLTAIPEGVKIIGEYAVSVNSVTSVEIPSSVTKIEDYAFYSCSGLSSVTLNEGLTSIGRNAFASCYNLESLTLPSTIGSIGNYAFENTGSNGSFTLYVPYSLKFDYSTSTYLNNLVAYSSYASIVPYVKPEKEFTTFAYARDVIFPEITGFKAYAASGVDLAGDGKVILKEVASAKAGEGIVIQAVAGTKYDLTLATASDNGPNLLIGVTEDTNILPKSGSLINFILYDSKFHTVKAPGGTLAGGKAYLQLSTSTARAKTLGISTDSDVTGIINIDIDGDEADNSIYDLNGRRISETATKGIYVKNGKKVIIK